LYVFFCVFPRRQIKLCRRFGTLCQVHLQRLDEESFFIKPLKMDLTEGSETSAKLNLTPGKYPKENIQDSEHGDNLKSRILPRYFRNFHV
jgi:hypothetical protein